MILCGDGMADYPIAELNGKTPLQVADTPNLNRLAGQGSLGMVRTVPPGFPPGSDVANLSIFGYDPALHYTGRAPLEAASMGVKLTSKDVAFRCNLITLGCRMAGSIWKISARAISPPKRLEGSWPSSEIGWATRSSTSTRGSATVT